METRSLYMFKLLSFLCIMCACFYNFELSVDVNLTKPNFDPQPLMSVCVFGLLLLWEANVLLEAFIQKSVDKDCFGCCYSEVFGALQVAQMGDGDQSQHRLAESKYIKNSS